MSREVMSYEEAAGYLGNRQFRASAEDRSRTVTTLRKAFNAQRLTEEEYNTRAERALGAVEQDELRRIVQDLPEAHAAHEPPATRWITSASKLRSAHCFAFHFSIALGTALIIAGSWTLPFLIDGTVSNPNGQSPDTWGILAIVITALGTVFGLVVNTLYGIFEDTR